MDYAVIPSLEHTALLQTVILCWSHDDTRDLIAEFHFRPLPDGEKKREWQKIEDKVLKQMSRLLPKSLKTRAIEFYEDIGLQVVKFIKYHKTLLSERKVVKESINKFSWTSQGLIDKKKTAKMLIKDEILNINARYALACIYCIEDDIPELWNRIPENDRSLFLDWGNPVKETVGFLNRSFEQWDLIVIWTHDIKGELANLVDLWRRYVSVPNLNIRGSSYRHAFEYATTEGNRAAAEYFLQNVTPAVRRESMLIANPNDLWPRSVSVPNLNTRDTAYRYAFEYAATEGNRAAAEYFLQKLTPEVRRESMLKIAEHIRKNAFGPAFSDRYSCLVTHSRVCGEYYADVLWFLLSQNNRMASLIGSAELMCFLDCPFPDSFFKILTRLWHFLSQDGFNDLLTAIIYKGHINDMDRKHRKLLREFWEQSPTTHKRSLLNKTCGGYLLLDLVKIEDENYIKLMFKDVTEGRKDFICGDGGLAICFHLFDNNKWDLMDFFIRECISSKHEIINFQQAFRNHLSKVPGAKRLVSEEKSNRLCQYFNNLVCEYDKRKSVEEGNGSSGKRLCNENENRLT